VGVKRKRPAGGVLFPINEASPGFTFASIISNADAGPETADEGVLHIIFFA
jgi:hypothetical protein